MTIFDVRDAAIASFKQISTVQGYSITVDADKVIAYYDENLLNRVDDAAYPKYMIFVERSNYQKGVGYSEVKTGEVNLFVIICQTDPEVTPSRTIEAIIKDVERWNRNDFTLNGLVTSFNLINMVTDGGVSAPEGLALFKFMARWDEPSSS